MSDKNYLIWSFEHNAWWRANSCGYTTAIAGAGLYTKEAAERICKNSNYNPGAVRMKKCALRWTMLRS